MNPKRKALDDAEEAYLEAFGEYPPPPLDETLEDRLAAVLAAVESGSRIPFPEEDLPEGALS